VTAPETNKNARGNPAEAVQPSRAARPDEVLPGVAESPGDPAPFGARGVPVGGAVDRPAVGVGSGLPVRGTARRLPRGVQYMEGVVTNVEVAGPRQPGVRLIVTVDTAQDWEAPPIPAGPGAQEVERSPLADAPVEATTDVNGDLLVPLAVTARTHLSKYVRSPEGIDKYIVPGGGTTRTADAANSTNIRKGEYVAVRYRRIGEKNVALNIGVVQLPRERLTGSGVPPVQGINIPRVPQSSGGNANTLPR